MSTITYTSLEKINSSNKNISRTKTKNIPKNIYVLVLTAIMGLSLLVFQPYSKILNMFLVLSDGSITFKYWQTSIVQLQIKVYIFNITNKDAFLEGREKLRFEEIGPYFYDEVAIHHNTTFNHDDGTIFSNPRYTLVWSPKKNTRKENDLFFIPNVPMLLFSNKVVTENSLLTMAINLFNKHSGSEPIIKRTASEYLFGYENVFTTFGHSLMPNWINFDKLGLIDRLFDHDNDRATTYSGEKNIRQAGLFSTYNDLPNLPYWEAPCDKLRGSTDGKKFGNNILRHEKIYIYIEKEYVVHYRWQVAINITNINELLTIEYDLEENIFDNGEVNPDNKCYCRHKRCLPRTIQDISKCYLEFDIGISLPHFYGANNTLMEKFDGLKPNATLHHTRLYIEPKTGYIVKGFVRLQLNAIFGDLSSVDNCERFSNMILPLIWAELGLPELPRTFHLLLMLIVRILPIVEIILTYSLLAVSILISVFKFQTLLCTRKKENDTEMKLRKENS